MSAINRAGSAVRALVQSDWSASAKAFGDALEGLSSSLENCTVGVAFFDHRRRCQALNRLFAAAWSESSEKFLGKTLEQSVGSAAKALKPAFKLVFSHGGIISNVPLLARQTANFYPFTDADGRVRVVAVTLREGSALDFHLGCLVAKLQMALPAATCLLGASFPEILARSLVSCTRAIRDFRNTASSRTLFCGTQLEIDLMPLALFLSLTGSRSPSEVAPTPMPVADHFAPERPAVQLVPPAMTVALLLDDPSPRELQVLRLLANGRSNKEIGIGLGISTRTVETYRARIIRKLGLHSTAELVRYAIRHGLVEV